MKNSFVSYFSFNLHFVTKVYSMHTHTNTDNKTRLKCLFQYGLSFAGTDTSEDSKGRKGTIFPSTTSTYSKINRPLIAFSYLK